MKQSLVLFGVRSSDTIELPASERHSRAKMTKYNSALIVDDDPVYGAFAECMIADAGILKIEVVDNVVAALALLDAGLNPDLLLCDLNMPTHDGVTLLRGLAEREFPGAIGIVSGEAPPVLDAVVKLARLQNLKILTAVSKPLDPTKVARLLTAGHGETAVNHSAPTIAQLQHVLAQNQLGPYFQAKICARTGLIAGAEALARIIEPGRLPQSPQPYVQLAENHGVIGSFTQEMLRQVASKARTFFEIDPNLTLAVNVSATSLVDLDFPDQLAGLVQSENLQCSRFILEITESDRLDIDHRTLDVMTRLRIKGFGLSADDFGTGYSNIERLRQVPYTELKIDRSFAGFVLTDSFARTCVESSVRLSRDLGLTVVAEGVEDFATWEVLRDLGVDYGQGYVFSRPLAPDAFLDFLKASDASGTTLLRSTLA